MLLKVELPRVTSQRITSVVWAFCLLAVFAATGVHSTHLQALYMATPPASAHMYSWYAGFFALSTLYAGLVAVMPKALGDVDAKSAHKTYVFVIAAVCALHLLAALTPPAMSVDPLSYFCHGVLGLLEPGGAYLHRVSSLDQSPYSGQLRALGWLPWHGISPYGPLWTHLEAWTAAQSGTAAKARCAFQLIAMLCNLCTAYSLYKVVHILRPAAKKQAVLFFLTHPIILFELSGEGHNDAAMLMCLMGALALTLRQRWILASLLLAAGAGVKYVPVIFAIPQWLYFRVSLGVSTKRWLGLGLVAAGLCAAFLVVCFLGLWVGPETFAGIADVSTPVSLASIFNQVWWQLHDAGLDTPAVVSMLSLLMRLLFLGYAGQLWWRASQGPQAVATAFFGTAFFYAVIASPTFWIWYLATPCALLVALGHKHAFYTALLIGWAGRIASPLDAMIRGEAITQAHATLLTTIVAAAIPLAYVLLAKPHMPLAVREPA
jgi:hypothetical protein